jgi:hypothetical protein
VYFKKPAIIRVRSFDGDDMNEAVAELEWVKLMISYWKKEARKEAYTNWLWRTKGLFCCIMCGQDDANVLQFHHLGEKFTGRTKADSISSMVRRQRPIYMIEQEMEKCTVLCANCHSKICKGGEEACEDVYQMSERFHGYGVEYYWPGDINDDTILNKQLFEKALADIPLIIPFEIVGFFDCNYLERHAAL